MYMYLREAWSACGGPGDVAHYCHCLGATIATNGVLLPSASCSGKELARFFIVLRKFLSDFCIVIIK